MAPSKLKRLRANKHMLYVLKNAEPKLRTALIKNCSDDVIKALTEIAINIVEGVHKISPNSKKNLEQYKLELRKLTSPTPNLTRKRKVLLQKGGAFIPILLSTVLSGLIGQLLQK